MKTNRGQYCYVSLQDKDAVNNSARASYRCLDMGIGQLAAVAHASDSRESCVWEGADWVSSFFCQGDTTTTKFAVGSHKMKEQKR